MELITDQEYGNECVVGENTGRWTKEEHELFLKGLEIHGKGWKQIATLIKTRTVVQIRTHAQKHFLKQHKNQLLENQQKNASQNSKSPSSPRKRKYLELDDMTHTNHTTMESPLLGLDTSSPMSTVSYPYEADSVATLFRASSGNTLHGFPDDYPWTQLAADTTSLESNTEHDVWSDLDERVTTPTNFMSTDCDSILFPYDDAVLCCGKQECQCEARSATVPAMDDDDDDLMNEDWVRILSDDQPSLVHSTSFLDISELDCSTFCN